MAKIITVTRMIKIILRRRSISDVTAATGLSESTIETFRDGTLRRPKFENYIKIARLYGEVKDEGRNKRTFKIKER